METRTETQEPERCRTKIEEHFDRLSDEMYDRLDKECENLCNMKVVVRREPNIWIQRLIMMLFGFLLGFLISRFVVG